MNTTTFRMILFGAALIIFGAVMTISESSPEVPAESGPEGYTGPSEVIFFEPIEIHVPVQVFDFSDEEPMLITPDMDE